MATINDLRSALQSNLKFFAFDLTVMGNADDKDYTSVIGFDNNKCAIEVLSIHNSTLEYITKEQLYLNDAFCNDYGLNDHRV